MDTNGRSDDQVSPEPAPAREDSRLARRVWGRYGGSPGVIPLSASRELAARASRVSMGRLPLLAHVQQRWGGAHADASHGPLALAPSRPIAHGAGPFTLDLNAEMGEPRSVGRVPRSARDSDHVSGRVTGATPPEGELGPAIRRVRRRGAPAGDTHEETAGPKPPDVPDGAGPADGVVQRATAGRGAGEDAGVRGPVRRDARAPGDDMASVPDASRDGGISDVGTTAATPADVRVPSAHQRPRSRERPSSKPVAKPDTVQTAALTAHASREARAPSDVLPKEPSATGEREATRAPTAGTPAEVRVPSAYERPRSKERPSSEQPLMPETGQLVTIQTAPLTTPASKGARAPDRVRTPPGDADASVPTHVRDVGASAGARPADAAPVLPGSTGRPALRGQTAQGRRLGSGMTLGAYAAVGLRAPGGAQPDMPLPLQARQHAATTTPAATSVIQRRPIGGPAGDMPLVRPLAAHTPTVVQTSTVPTPSCPAIPSSTSVPASTSDTDNGTDVDAVADKVLRKLMRRLAIERERRGWRR